MDSARHHSPPPGGERSPEAGGRPPNPPAFNVPPVTLAVTGVLIAVFAVLTLAPVSWTAAAIQWFAVRPTLVADAVRDPAQFRAAIAAQSLLTHALIHLDGLHLALNAGFLLAFGSICERVFGTRRVIGILVLSALAGAGAKLTMDWDTPLYMIGASGAVFGCMGAFIRLLIGGPPRARRGALALLAALVVVNLVFTFFGPTVLGVDGRIAWDAHVGGFLAGFLLGWPPRRRMMRAAV